MKRQEIRFCAAMAFFFVALLLALSAYASPGDIHTLAGTGAKGYSGDGGPANAADLSNPYGVCVDASGSVYFSDGPNHVIRKVDVSGKVSTMAVSGLKNPAGVCMDAAGNLYVADSFNNRVLKVSPSGAVTTAAGNGRAGFSGDGGLAAAASLNRPYGVAVDAGGSLYIADSYNHAVRKVLPAGVITTVAGNGKAGYAGDGGKAAQAQFNRPESVVFDAAGNLYVADTYNSVVRKIDKAGSIMTVAGNGKRGFSGDGGPAVSASLDYPTAVAVGASGEIFISDFNNHRLRVVDSSGTIKTVAGTGTAKGFGDGGPAASAGLKFPFGTAVDASGNLYIADSGNFRVRMLESAKYELPTSVIASPENGSAVSGAQVAISGKADASGGVAFVEVSTDGGATWTQASGTSDWSFNWKPQDKGEYSVLSRATNTAGNTGTIMGYANVTVRQTVVKEKPGRRAKKENAVAVSAAQASAPVVSAAAQPVQAANLPSNSPGRRIYGPGIQSVSLQETGVGKYSGNQRCALRFRADHTGSIASVLQYLIWSASKPLYNGGTGGSALKVEIQADNPATHLPSGKALASAILAYPMKGSHFPVIKFSKPAPVRQGQVYHIVYTNMDANPAANWISVDNLIAASGTAAKPLQPGLSDDFAVEVSPSSSGAWSVRPNQTPIFQVNFADGHKAGVGYMEVMVQNPHIVRGGAMVREAFAVSGASQTVKSASVKLRRTGGSGKLIVRLENGDGSVIQEVPVPASSVSSSDAWVTAAFTKPLTLQAGRSYNLVLKTDSATTYSVYTVQRGDKYGFDKSTYFSDGYAQFTAGSGWTGWTKAGGKITNMLNSDLQFYFSTL